MSLSDEVLTRPELLAAAKKLVQELVHRAGARSAFLIDERGVPFAAAGNVEFTFPDPLVGLEDGAILAALVGEETTPLVVVERVSDRALLALLIDDAARRDEVATAAREAAVKLAVQLAFKRDSPELG